MTATQDAPVSEARMEIGRDRRRKEDQRLITGRTRWTDNITLPGMLHLAMVRSPFAHAKITAINVDEAKAAPNVVTVITGKDVAEEQGSDDDGVDDGALQVDDLHWGPLCPSPVADG